jgi:hypothetical protein
MLGALRVLITELSDGLPTLASDMPRSRYRSGGASRGLFLVDPGPWKAVFRDPLALLAAETVVGDGLE